MQILSLFPGSVYVSQGDHSLLAGCPPEIVKVLLQRGLRPPMEILLPDRGVSHGESQVAVEFPLYHHLFFGQGLGLGKPLRLIGGPRRLAAAVELIRLTLFGPDEKQLRAWESDGHRAESLAAETRWFQVKDKTGKAIPMDALVNQSVLEDGEVDLGWLRIRRVRTNVFQLTPASGEPREIDLTPPGEQVPPYPVAPDLTPTTLVKLGVEVLGGSTGFSATQASSGLAAC